MRRLVSLLILLLILVPAQPAAAQDYYFSLPNYEVHAYWNEDGTLGIFYSFEFANDPRGHVIDYVDVGLPNGNFNVRDIFADVNGIQLSDISRSGYEGTGVGVAVGLGGNAIPAGGRGTVNVHITRIERVLFPDDQDENYVSAVFSPAWWVSQVVYGTTNMSVTFHLPPGVQPDEPRWHSAPSGFPSEPDTGIDEDGRVLYTWRSSEARPDRQYFFGASFPRQNVPEDTIGQTGAVSGPGAVVSPSGPGFLSGLDLSCLIPFCFFGFFILIFFAGIFGERKRKLQYLPPKVSIEGHGIKRGLTAVEAAILMEQPVDKVLTMILFGLIKKNAVQVASRDPLNLEIADPLPGDLRPYELSFVEAFKQSKEKARQLALQDVIINLIKSVSQKMKGFSRRETLAYYKDIMERAWKQVEVGDTPEVKSQKFDENMEWTMLDRDFDRRTRDVFRTGPVYVPVWWPRYDPTYGRPSTTSPSTTIPTSAPGRPSTGGGPSLPTLPGGEFAASMVGGMQNFSSKVVGNLTDFTGRITRTTNPPPPPSRSTGSGRGGGGGGGCACACACAGCACACAGGGR
jgi:hypothetical protein